MRLVSLVLFSIVTGNGNTTNNNGEKLPTMELGHLDPKGDYIDEINNGNKIDEELFQGDIYLNEMQTKIIISELEQELARPNTNGTNGHGIRENGVRLWNNFTVNYIFNTSLNEKAKRAFRKGADMWAKDTCIKFQHYVQLQDIDDVEILKKHGKDLLIVEAMGGCWSSLGKTGGLQQISLAEACETSSIAAHEIGHTLGFYHSISRHDRDKYLIIDFENIQEKWDFREYEWQTSEEIDSQKLGYDYGSIMHNRKSYAAIDPRQPTLMPIDKDYGETLGSPFVSFIDGLMLNKLYGCDKLCERKQKRDGKYRNGKIRNKICQNGGYLHPLSCSKCVCPEGYAGKLCSERPKGSPKKCGNTYDASTEWKSLTDSLGDYEEHEIFTKCYYWIQSPKNTEIEVELVSFSGPIALEGCPYAGIEIKTNENQQLTGYRFCSPKAAGIRLRSNTNRVPIIRWNKVNVSEALLRYRHVSKDEARPTTERHPKITQAPPTITVSHV
ncbi:hypothetical protein V3C99_001217 [Haemonchus contortus]